MEPVIKILLVLIAGIGAEAGAMRLLVAQMNQMNRQMVANTAAMVAATRALDRQMTLDMEVRQERHNQDMAMRRFFKYARPVSDHYAPPSMSEAMRK